MRKTKHSLNKKSQYKLQHNRFISIPQQGFETKLAMSSEPKGSIVVFSNAEDVHRIKYT